MRRLHAFAVPVTLAAAAVLAVVGCSKKGDGPEIPECKPSPVKLTSWQRIPFKYADATILVPPGTRVDPIPLDEKSIGERWNADGWGMYYKFDSVRTDHGVEGGPQVTNMTTCKDNSGGVEATITRLHSDATSMQGQFGQAQWTIDGRHTLFIALLTPNETANDSMLAMFQSIRFGSKK